MSQPSLTRKIARLTRRFRASLGLAELEAGPAGSLPFRRALPNGKRVPARLEAIENDLDRLLLGWNQHLPQMLAAVGEARQIAQQEPSKAEIEQLRLRVAHLEGMVAALATRIDPSAPSAPARGASPGEVAPTARPAPRTPAKTVSNLRR